MNKTQEALKMAIEAMETCDLETETWSVVDIALAIHACKEALEQQEQEPVAWKVIPRYEDEEGYFDFTDNADAIETLQHRGWKTIPLYTHPAKQWQGLTSEDIRELDLDNDVISVIFQTEAKLKEKNNGQR